MPVLFVSEITHNRSAQTRNYVHCVEVKKHHVLFCRSEKGKADQKSDLHVHAESASHATHGAGLALYPIQQAKVCESGKNISMFCDDGSNTTYITHETADRIKAKKLNKFILDVTTVGNVEKNDDTRQYQFTLRTDTGKKVSVTAFGMDRITGPVSRLDTKVLTKLFPDYDPTPRSSTRLITFALIPILNFNQNILSLPG